MAHLLTERTTRTGSANDRQAGKLAAATPADQLIFDTGTSDKTVFRVTDGARPPLSIADELAQRFGPQPEATN